MCQTWVLAAGQILGNRTSPCLREPHSLAGGVPGTYSGPPPSTARLPPDPEDADLFLEPQKQQRRRAGPLLPPGGDALQGGPPGGVLEARPETQGLLGQETQASERSLCFFTQVGQRKPMPMGNVCPGGRCFPGLQLGLSRGAQGPVTLLEPSDARENHTCVSANGACRDSLSTVRDLLSHADTAEPPCLRPLRKSFT